MSNDPEIATDLVTELLDLLVTTGVLSSRQSVQEVRFRPRFGGDVAIRVRRDVRQRPRPSARDSMPAGVRDIAVSGSYLNLTFETGYLKQRALKILLNDPSLGLCPASATSPSLAVEHTSMTPVYPINVATYRGTVLGDALARLYSLAGATVTRCFWVDDQARQVKLVAEALRLSNTNLASLARSDDKPDHVVGRVFASALYRSRRSNLYRVASGYDAMFPHARVLPEVQAFNTSNETHSTTTDSDLDISRYCVGGFAATLRATDVPIDHFDYTTELRAHQQVDLLLRGATGVSGSDASVRDSPYYVDNVRYYIAQLLRFDSVISVVSHRQRQLLVRAGHTARRIADGAGLQSKLLQVFFGEVLTEPHGLDRVANGVFTSVDDYVDRSAARLNLKTELAACGLKLALLRHRTLSTVRLSRDLNVDGQRLFALTRLLTSARRLEEPRGLAGRQLSYSEEHLHRILLRLAQFPKVLRTSLEEHCFARFVQYVFDLLRDVRSMPSDSTLPIDVWYGVRIVIRTSLNVLGLDALADCTDWR